MEVLVGDKSVKLESRRVQYDKFGFAIVEKGLNMAVVNYAKRNSADRANVDRKWREFTEDDPNFLNEKKFKKLIRNGVPDSLRARVWCHCLGSEMLKSENPLLFYELADAPLEHEISDQIELDLPRTFPNHVNFQDLHGLNRLRRVLRAFAAYKQDIKYCQSLNFIAAMLLIIMPEDLAFWSLCQMIDSEIPGKGMKLADYYTSGMKALRRDLKVLDSILKKRAPKAYNAILSCQVDVDWICSGWFLCLFVTILPISTVVRIWDILINEGPKIIFRVAVAIFLRYKVEIAALKTLEQVMLFFKEKLIHLIDHEEFIHLALKGLRRFSRKEIIRYRVKADDQFFDS